MACRRRRLVERTDPRPSGHPAARLSRSVISATCFLVALPRPRPPPPAHRGQTADHLLIAAAGDRHPAGEPRSCGTRTTASRCLMSSWLAPAPSTRTSNRDAHAGGDLADRCGQHGEVVGEGVRAGVARPQQHRQRLGGISQPGPQWMEAVAHLEGRCCPFLVAVRGDQSRVQVDDQPPRQHLPGDGQPREPARPRADQLPHVRPDRRPAPGRSCPGSPDRPVPASAAPWYRSARPPRPVAGAPARRYRSCSWPPARSPPPWRPASSRDRSAGTSPPGPAPRRARTSGRTDPRACEAAPPRHDRSGPLRPRPRTGSGPSAYYSPLRSAPVSADCNVWLPRNLPERGALRYLRDATPLRIRRRRLASFRAL